MPDVMSTEPQEVEKEEDQEESEDKPHPAPIKDKKHDSGAADLEKGEVWGDSILIIGIIDIIEH